MKFQLISTFIGISLALTFQACEKENLPPSCSILQPSAGTEFENNTSIEIEVQASDPDGEVEMVKLWLDDALITNMEEPPFNYNLGLFGKPPGNYTLKTRAIDEEGLTASDEIHFFIKEIETIPDSTDIPETPVKTEIRYFILTNKNLRFAQHEEKFIGQFKTYTYPENYQITHTLYSDYSYPDNEYFRIEGNNLFYKDELLTLDKTMFHINVKAEIETGDYMEKNFKIYDRKEYYQAQVIYKPPTCDGFIDDVEDPWYTEYEGWREILNPLSANDENLTSRFCMLHSDTHLFIAVVVDDSGDFNSNNPLERDRIEIYLSMEDEVEEDGKYTEGCWAISFNIDENEELSHGHFSGYYGGDSTNFENLLNAEQYFFGSHRDNDAYVVEMSLPIDILVGYSDFNGERILFDIAVTDYDENGFNDKKYWYSASGKQGYDTRELGVVELIQPKVE